MNIQKYILEPKNYDISKLLSAWIWLVEDDDYTIMVITKMGHLLVKDADGHLYFLNTTEGSFEQLSNYAGDFANNKLAPAQYFEIFQPEIMADLEEDAVQLQEDEVYSFIEQPVMGGIIDAGNIECIDIYKHFALTGYLHKEVYDMKAENNQL